jgi:hypothetical protein
VTAPPVTSRTIGEALPWLPNTPLPLESTARSEEEVATSQQQKGFARVCQVLGETNDTFFHGLDDFLLSTFTYGFCL